MTTSESQPTVPVTFRELLNDEQLLASLDRLGFVQPTPVQEKGLPPLLAGRDLIAQAKTGSGKTLAFVLPMLLKLRNVERALQTRALVLTPTRELANQICGVISSVAPAVHPTCVIGGVSFNTQRQSLEQDARIVVGTPGRVLDLIRQRTILLRHCSYFVVDEADEMFSMDFVEDVQAILSRIPDVRQGIFCSATITPRVESLANNFLAKPERVVIDTPGEALPPIDHLYYNVGGGVTDKAQALCDIIETTLPRSAIIFCNTKSDTELVEVFLRRRGFDAAFINSDLSQAQRDEVMARIKAQELQFLVGTDIAARGIDIKELDLVVNYSLPEQPEVYVHRTGRTGRAGNSGRAVSLIGPQDFSEFVNLKRKVELELKNLPLPTDQEVTRARLAHLYAILREAHIELRPQDLDSAQKVLHDLAGLEQPSEEIVDLVAKLCRFAVEHAFSSAANGAEQTQQRPQEDPAARRPGRQPSRQSRGRDSRGRGNSRYGGSSRGRRR